MDNSSATKTISTTPSFLARGSGAILDFLFPIHCLGCQIIMPTSSPTPYLCLGCLEKIKPTSQLQCLFCSSLNPTGKTCPVCRETHALDYLWPAANYDDPFLKRALWAYKYKFVSSLHSALSLLLVRFLQSQHKEEFLKTNQENLVIIPVPLHPRRLRWRSYNQSALLAEELSRVFQLELIDQVLARPKRRRPQTAI
ncbi:MAG: hypothetical protein Q7S32_01450, partial [bacterium]|nr:hypothetical protein [bacterium]